ncbi:MAG: GntR family transcriptional regulator [Chloroflexota bacterium]|nr:GntR family transcriptional regulator [Chloroflexota bacterium]
MIQYLPLYAQIKEIISDQIEKGELVPGDRIPSQRELCKQYDVSHMTVRRAISELIHEGVIFAIPGKGLYVAEKAQFVDSDSLTGFEEQMTRLGVGTTTKMLDSGVTDASVSLARMMGVVVGAPLIYMSRLRLANNEPHSITHVYLPRTLCPSLLDYDLAANSLFETLRTQYGLNLASSISTIGSLLANEEQAALLNLSQPAALLFRRQLTFLDTGQVIELSRSYMRGDIHCIQMAEGDPSVKRLRTENSVTF